MRVIGKEDLLEPLNRSALQIAKKVADNPIKGTQPNLMGRKHFEFKYLERGR